MWTWTVTSSPGRYPQFAQIGHKPTEAAAWRQAENVLLACEHPHHAKAAA
jgi:hypothetical protein